MFHFNFVIVHNYVEYNARDSLHYHLFSKIYTEVSAEFTAVMKPQKVSEGDSASFTCELSKPVKSVVWKRNGKKIENDENLEITSSGTKYTLSLLKTSVDDSGEYTMSIGEKQASAKLVVSGKHEVFVSGTIESTVPICKFTPSSFWKV